MRVRPNPWWRTPAYVAGLFKAIVLLAIYLALLSFVRSLPHIPSEAHEPTQTDGERNALLVVGIPSACLLATFAVLVMFLIKRSRVIPGKRALPDKASQSTLWSCALPGAIAGPLFLFFSTSPIQRPGVHAPSMTAWDVTHAHLAWIAGHGGLGVVCCAVSLWAFADLLRAGAPSSEHSSPISG